MARLRPIKVVNVLTFEETTRVSNVFMLLVEIDLRSPRSTKSKTRKNTKAKAKQPTSPHLSHKASEGTARLRRPRPIKPYSAKSRVYPELVEGKGKKEPFYIKCPARRSSRTARRDLYLQAYYIQSSQFFLN